MAAKAIELDWQLAIDDLAGPTAQVEPVEDIDQCPVETDLMHFGVTQGR
jgi:hypothetical protein